MSVAIRSWSEKEVETLRALAAHPSLCREFELLQGHGLEERLADVFNLEDLRRVAALDGRDVGFAYTFVFPTTAGVRAAARIGVIDGARRRGVGRALLEATLERLRARVPECRGLALSATQPNPEATAFAKANGFPPVRQFWLMERSDHSIPDSDWPAGVELGSFDAARDIPRWVDVFNRSWAEHWHGVLMRESDVRQHLESGAVDPEGIRFAQHSGEDIGFVRLALHEGRGEIAVVGVVPEWRRRGLGRALLRFGARWLLEHGASRVTLAVDGENERALTLYQKERYQVVETRQVWEKEF
jgi:mycothiol synthase